MALLGALAFALQLLLPLVHTPPVAAVPAAAEAPAHAAHAGDHDGHHAHAAPEPPRAPAEHAGGHECPLCNVVKSFGALPPSGAPLLRQPVETGPVRPAVTVDTAEGLDRYRLARPRAPPLPR